LFVAPLDASRPVADALFLPIARARTRRHASTVVVCGVVDRPTSFLASRRVVTSERNPSARPPPSTATRRRARDE